MNDAGLDAFFSHVQPARTSQRMMRLRRLEKEGAFENKRPTRSENWRPYHTSRNHPHEHRGHHRASRGHHRAKKRTISCPAPEPKDWARWFAWNWKRHRRELARRQRERYPEKERARLAFSLALRRGEIDKPTSCEKCGVEPQPSRLHGHHYRGYEFPLSVQWLCAQCHGRERALRRDAVESR